MKKKIKFAIDELLEELIMDNPDISTMDIVDTLAEELRNWADTLQLK